MTPLKEQKKQKALDRQLVAAAAAGNNEGILYCLRQGADINGARRGFLKQTALLAAAYHGHASSVELLLEKGADHSACDVAGQSALHEAIVHKDLDMLETLLRYGADPDLGQQRGGTGSAREYALRKEWYAALNAFDKAAKARDGVLPENAPAEDPAEDNVPSLPATEGAIILQRPLGARVLQEEFNFRTRERITLVLAGPDGPAEAVTRQNFRDIDDQSPLLAAFAAYKKAGGKVEEDEAFPNRLPKDTLQAIARLQRP